MVSEPDLTIPEIVEAINPPHKALGIGYFASMTLRSVKAPRTKAFLRLNIQPGGRLLVDRGYFRVASNGMLDMTHARLQGLHEYRMCEGLLIVTVQHIRDAKRLGAILTGDAPATFAEYVQTANGSPNVTHERLEAFARAWTATHGYPMKHAVIAMRNRPKDVAEHVGCGWAEVVEWASNFDG
jgi:hypothetical protein